MSLNYPVPPEATSVAEAGSKPGYGAFPDHAAEGPSQGLPEMQPEHGVRRDLSVLAWVAPSLRAALEDATTELGHFVDEVRQAPEALGARDTTSLRLAGQQLHQAAGAVHIVGLRGVDPYSQALRRLLDGVDAGTVPANAATLGVFRASVLALAEYVDDLMAGDDEEPLRLFRSYADVLGCLGEDRVHPADLWVDELQALPGILLPIRMPSAVARARQKFEAALLNALRLPDSCNDGALLREAFLPLQSALDDVRASEQEPRRTSDHPDRGLWYVLSLVFGALAHGMLPCDLLAKRLGGRAHLLLRQYAQGHVRVPQTLLNDALFLLVSTGLAEPGRAAESEPVLVLRSAIRQCLRAFRIDTAHAAVRANFRARHYGLLDPIDTRNLQQAAAAMQAFATSRPNRAERADRVDANDQRPWQTALAALAEAAQPLEQPALLRCLDAVARYVRAGNGHPAADPALGSAGIALFLSRTLAMPWRVHGGSGHPCAAEFARRCDALADGLPVPGAKAPTWLADMVEQARMQALRADAVAQLRGSLDGGESWLDAYDRDAARPESADHLRDARQAFAALHATLQSLGEGGLLPESLRGDAEAAGAAVQGVASRLGRLQGEPAIGRAEHLAVIAAELGGVHAFIDSLEFGAKGAPQGSDAEQHAEAAEIGLGADAQRAATTPAQQLLAQARSAASQAIRGTASPDAAGVQALRAALRGVTEQAGIDDDRTLRRQAEEAGTQLNAWLAGSDDAAQRMLAALADPLPPAPAPTLAAQPAPAPTPQDSAALDAELLDIFLMEADDVLAEVGRTLDAGLPALADSDALYGLRRGFHTLKGSSRMVGLGRYGDAAWAVEQVLNLWIAEGRGPAPALHALLGRAHEELSTWVQALRADPTITQEFDELVAQAQALRAAVPGPAPASAVAVDAEPSTATTAAAPGDAIGTIDPVAGAGDAAAGSDDANVIPFPFASTVNGEDDNYKTIGPVRIGLQLYNVYLQEADSLIRQFATDLSEWRHEGHPCPSEMALRVAHTMQGSAATVGLTPVRELAEALERLLLQLSAHPVAMHPGDFRLLDQAVERIRAMLHQFAAGIWPESEPALCRGLAEFTERAMVRPRLPVPSHGAATPAGVDAPVAMLFGHVAAPHEHKLAEAQAPEDARHAAGPHDAVVIPLPPVHAAEAGTPTSDAALDPALVEIFLEEAHGSLPELGKLLRTWEAAPDNAGQAGLMLRALHTLKGGARMAGAMALGQAAHEMETLLDGGLRGRGVGPQLFGRLYAWYDRILAHVEALQAGRLLPVDDPDAVNGLPPTQGQPDAANDTAGTVDADGVSGAVSDVATDVSGASVDTGAALIAVPASAPTPIHTELAAVTGEPGERQRALVRVQARTLDALINDAGEVGATRARLESELGSLRSYLGELNDNVARLRGQLREIEIQAESQMASRTADAGGKRDFDPLEFDRFTRFQELTRMMAESVNDVATVEQNLQRGFDRASGNLDTQARLTRGLQRSLMQARMVQFDTLAERLYRVARQAATETGKEVRLLIKGGTVEVDRSVLERMAGPIEHLIRNAVVHGIESAERRTAAGKPAAGALTLEVQQEGNEVVLHFVDDGGGLDLARIRERAVERELLAVDDEANEARLTELIFTPGFSTAESVSELAGRGVGMDVVRAETVALGGRIALSTEPGRGTRFTMHLPLTTAITQVLLVSLGGRLFAVPSGMIEQVQQLRSHALLDTYNRGTFATTTGDVPFHYLGTLLEEASAIAAGRKYSPVVVVRSGADRLAVHVDEVVGNREVVVKHIGPHLARLEGIAGATTLGDGEIVLIYNPVVLAQRFTRERGESAPARLPPGLQSGLSTHLPNDRHAGQARSMGAVAEFGGGGAMPVDGLATQPTVMVVDDSLTVRKATHRLLTRAGYEVVLARDGVDALKQLQDVMPDAMLVDIEMPHMDGFDLTRNVRADTRTAQMPLVIISSRTAEKHRRYAAEIGVNVFLGKPYNEDELLATLHQLIGARALGTAGSVAEMLEGGGSER